MTYVTVQPVKALPVDAGSHFWIPAGVDLRLVGSGVYRPAGLAVRGLDPPTVSLWPRFRLSDRDVECLDKIGGPS